MDDRRLDELLDTWRVEPASANLREAVLAGAPRPRRAGLRLPRLDARLWFAGAGVAAGIAGLSCGAAFASVAVRDARDEALVASAARNSAGEIAAIAEPAPLR